MIGAVLRRALALTDVAAGRIAARAGDTVREQLDGYAFAWLMTRRRLDRQRAAELLERLGAELGAKIELQDLP